MPPRPLQPCRYPGGCTQVQVEPYCQAHGQQRERAAHKVEHQRLYDRRWRRMRAEQLAKEPWCAACLQTGRHTLATDVDHVVPHRGDLDLFYNGKLESLCHTCHSSKTAVEVGLHPPRSKKF